MSVAISIIPNYSLHYQALYIELARAAIKSCRNLDILSIPHGAGSAIPSWVPNWSDSNRLPNTLFKLGQGTPGRISDTEAFAASGKFFAEPNIVSSATELILNGHEIDNLEVVADPFRWADGSEVERAINRNAFTIYIKAQSSPDYDATADPMVADMKQQQRVLVQLLLDFYNTMICWKKLADETTADAHASGVYAAGETSETVLLLTLEGGSNPSGSQATAKCWEHFFATLQRGANAATRVLSGDASVTVNELYEPIRLPDEHREFQEWDAPLYGPVNRRRLARTKRGYLALVGPEAREGDDVVLLHGGRTPYIVRRIEGQTKFVSDAYVHGIMYGEAWDPSLCHEIRLV